MSAAKTCPLWKKYLDDGMKASNAKTTSNAQVVQKWAILSLDFCEKNGELTPTLKLKVRLNQNLYPKPNSNTCPMTLTLSMPLTPIFTPIYIPPYNPTPIKKKAIRCG